MTRCDNLVMKTQRKMKIGMSHIASLERITIQVSIRVSGDIIASKGLSEKDLQDPELINELKAMGYVEKKKQKKQIINQQIPVQQAKKVASSLEIKN